MGNYLGRSIGNVIAVVDWFVNRKVLDEVADYQMEIIGDARDVKDERRKAAQKKAGKKEDAEPEEDSTDESVTEEPVDESEDSFFTFFN